MIKFIDMLTTNTCYNFWTSINSSYHCIVLVDSLPQCMLSWLGIAYGYGLYLCLSVAESFPSVSVSNPSPNNSLLLSYCCAILLLPDD